MKFKILRDEVLKGKIVVLHRHSYLEPLAIMDAAESAELAKGLIKELDILDSMLRDTLKMYIEFVFYHEKAFLAYIGLSDTNYSLNRFYMAGSQCVYSFSSDPDILSCMSYDMFMDFYNQVNEIKSQ